MVEAGYAGPDRRQLRPGDDPITLDDLTSALRDHAEQERRYVTEMIGAFASDAFPEGPTKHKEYHQAKINSALAEEKFWSELKLDLAKKGLWGIITILAGMTILGFGAWVAGLPHMTIPK